MLVTARPNPGRVWTDRFSCACLKPMKTTILLGTLAAVVLLAVAFVGCSDPHASGVALGQRHANELKEGSITYERLSREFAEGEAQQNTAEAQSSFETGYIEGIEPARSELAALYRANAAKRVGKTVGKTIREVIDSVSDAVDELSKDEEAAREEAKKLGRRFGRIVRGIEEAVEAAAEGFEEELKDPDSK